MRVSLWMVAILSVAAACGDDADPDDAGSADGGGEDAGSPDDAGAPPDDVGPPGEDGGTDAGRSADAGHADAGGADAGRADAGRADAGRADAGRMDAGRMDAGRPDAGRPDAGAPDAGMADAGRADAGRPDAGAPDAGVLDAGMPDAGASDAGPACPPVVIPSLAFETVARDLDKPIFVAQPPGTTDTLFIVEQRGRIVLLRGGSVLATPFLDIQTTIGPRPAGNSERGLLGLAFHPRYATNRRFFVFYTPTSSPANDTVVEFRAMAGDPDRADPTPVRTLVEVDTLQGNHNGGMLAFGPDGYLYVGMGDGGGAGDTGTGHGPIGNGQNTGTLHGSILRLDVNAAAAGFAAPGNPFEAGGGLPQIWAYGLRNPWRFSFDARVGDLYVGDVGQGTWEEVDYQPVGAPGGANYGWRGYEGLAVFDSDVAALVATHAEPVVVVRHSSASEPVRGACSITGGYVYRGTAIPALDGVYLYGDFCSTDLGALRVCEGAATGHQRVGLPVPRGLASFGQDQAGEIYVVIRGDRDGEVRRIIAGP